RISSTILRIRLLLQRSGWLQQHFIHYRFTIVGSTINAVIYTITNYHKRESVLLGGFASGVTARRAACPSARRWRRPTPKAAGCPTSQSPATDRKRRRRLHRARASRSRESPPCP